MALAGQACGTSLRDYRTGTPNSYAVMTYFFLSYLGRLDFDDLKERAVPQVSFLALLHVFMTYRDEPKFI